MSRAAQTWQVFSAIASRLMGLGHLPPQAVDDVIFGVFAKGVLEDECAWAGLSAEEMKEKLAPQQGPARLVDMLLRTGPYGDGFGRRPGGLTLAQVQAAPHGIDLGPLEPHLSSA